MKNLAISFVFVLICSQSYSLNYSLNNSEYSAFTQREQKLSVVEAGFSGQMFNFTIKGDPKKNKKKESCSTKVKSKPLTGKSPRRKRGNMGNTGSRGNMYFGMN